MNPPTESGPTLGARARDEAIQRHANEVLHLALGLANMATVDDRDGVLQACEAIVIGLACITSAQDLELREILPTESCQECGRPCLDFERSKATGDVTCVPCLIAEAEKTAVTKAARRQRDAELDAAWSQGHESGKRTAAEIAQEPTPRAVRCTRGTVLDDARHATMQREERHGAPGVMFLRIAELWSSILGHRVRAHHVALCQAALKIARAVEDPTHGDNWVDLAGYAACGGEVALARRSA